MATARGKKQDQDRLSKAELKNKVAGKLTQRKVLEAACAAADAVFYSVVWDMGGRKLWTRLSNEAKRYNRTPQQHAEKSLS